MANSFKNFSSTQTMSRYVTTSAMGGGTTQSLTTSSLDPLQMTTFYVPDGVPEYLDINDIEIKGKDSSGNWADLTISQRNASLKTVTLSANATSQSKTEIRMLRHTQTTPLVNFVDGARLTESDLDKAYRQGLFVAQETSEDAQILGTTISNLTDLTLGGTTTAANLTATGTVSLPASTNLSVTNLTTTGVVQIPSGTDANHFYREGNYTAAMTCATSGTITLKTDNNYNTGYYIKIGKLVRVSGDIRVASVSSPTGLIALSLPFPVASTSRYLAPIITHGIAKQSEQLGAFFLQAVGGTSTANISYNKDNATNASLSGTIAADNELKFTLTYQTT